MRKTLLILFIPIIGFSLYKEGEVLVKVKEKRAISSLGVSFLSSSYLFDNIYKLSFSPSKSVFDVILSLKQNPDVIYAEPNYIRRICAFPNDPDFNNQWGLDKISAPLAWDIEKGTEGVIIAILDTGVDYNHPDLGSKTILGYDFANNDNDPMDDHDYLEENSHGTHVAGIAAASTNNSIGIAGLAWNCKILAVKCLNYKGYGDDDKIAKAIKYAADYGAKVINMSWGGEDNSQTIKEACDYAYNKGVFLVAAAGNDGNTTKFYPAGYDSVMAVAATDKDDNRAWFSNYGDWVDVAAPGKGIYSTLRTGYGYYGNKDGTSMASPYVSGLAGLLFSRYPGWDNYKVAMAIREGCDNINDPYIKKRINAYNSLNFNISTKTWTFMVYLDGDNDLEKYAISDFLEMAKVGSNKDINIVVQFDRIDGYDDKYGDWKTTKRFYITKGMTPTSENAIMDIGEANMGDPNTLKSFINWAKISYPAENYALVLWNHGKGWKIKEERPRVKAICIDDTNEDILSLKELREALSPFKLSLIGFDACLMAMLEVAYEIKDYGGIMVSSEEEEPGDGWDYEKILANLTSTTTPGFLAETIVKTYVESYPNDKKITLSSIDLSKIENLAFSLGSITSINDRNRIKGARDKTISLSDPSYIDLLDFANNLEISLISPILFSSRTSSSNPYLGISIYFPLSDDGYLGSYTEDNLLFLKDTGWDEFILRFLYPPSPSIFSISCPETITTHNTFTLTVSVYMHPFPQTITISNITNSITPKTATLTGTETKIIAIITESPNYGSDTISVKLSSLIATSSVNVFISTSTESQVLGNNVSLSIPPNTFNVPVVICISTSSTTGISGIKPVASYEIIAMSSSGVIKSLKGTITAEFSYNETNGIVEGTIKEKDLRIFQDGNEIPYFINPSSNTIIATITQHLSLFTIGGTQTYPEIITKPTVFPNPFIWNKHQFITFGDPNIIEKRLPPYGDIKIYNIKGEIIDELSINPEDNGQKIWKLKEKGLASGVYLFAINKKAFGKIGVIK